MPKRPLALSMGDPAGIGPEITRKAWCLRHQEKLPPFVVIGNPQAYQDALFNSGTTNLSVPIKVVANMAEGAQVFADALPVIVLDCPSPPVPGKPDSQNSNAVIKSIELSVEAVLKGEASGLVTNPISKALLYDAGFKHPGHTEFLSELARTRSGSQVTPVMMLASPDLKVVPVTVHIPLRDVADALTTENIVETARITARGLHIDFALPQPRIAITGLNPHAGENGAMGDEEERIIRPAIEILKAGNINVTGPHPADTIFHATARQTYDAVIAMYHDQALIPLKTLAFDSGINITLGLPFIRTSPDHGTAFDIAGQDRASQKSLVEALKSAWQLAENRHCCKSALCP